MVLISFDVTYVINIVAKEKFLSVKKKSTCCCINTGTLAHSSIFQPIRDYLFVANSVAM